MLEMVPLVMCGIVVLWCNAGFCVTIIITWAYLVHCACSTNHQWCGYLCVAVLVCHSAVLLSLLDYPKLLAI